MNNPFIIGEVGINHNGNIGIAKQLIDMAKLCGCDAVKFQKRTIGLVYSDEFLRRSRESPWGTTQLEQKLGLELNSKDYKEIDVHCRKIGIDWFASAWDIKSQEFLRQFNLNYNKIASPMISNPHLLLMVAEEGKQTFISTGAGNEEDLEAAVDLFSSYDCPFTLMHAILKYPCPDEECHLLEIGRLKKKYKCSVGISSHNPSILPTSLAVSLGAEAIEIHITLDRTMYGSDQSASFEKHGLETVVRDARRVWPILKGG